jgi:hypothetical protein
MLQLMLIIISLPGWLTLDGNGPQVNKANLPDKNNFYSAIRKTSRYSSSRRPIMPACRAIRRLHANRSNLMYDEGYKFCMTKLYVQMHSFNFKSS